ncbi:glycosyltransferase [Pigmentiphaga sp. NML080357]|uniref:glycosyltransferase n=1 Tax=Pigmentiphaga sp. NML080357 TaxID=2008675 RepID=UPI001302ECED|nr:glycosyltransferase [Pigmentiphaga sp. NML080357]
MLVAKYLEEDRLRLQENYFGLDFRASKPYAHILLLGARSGLEIVRFLTASSSAKIVVVEPNLSLKRELDDCLENIAALAWRERVVFFASMEELYGSAYKNFSLVRADSTMFDPVGVEELINRFCIDHICGDFDPWDADPIDVYRTCRARVKSFHWRVMGRDSPLSWSGPAPAFEVSVVVPAYKVLAWIDRCMQTLVDQTLASLEIIAVDDGSPDATGTRLDEWAQKYPGRVKVIHKPNGGCASARNAGARVAQGEYVAFVDGDDWVDTNMFEALYRSAVLNAADVAQCGYIEAFEDSGRLELYSTAWGAASGSRTCGLVEDPLSYLVVKPTIWRRIYRKEFLCGNAIEFPEHIPRFDDLPFQFEVLARVKRMSIIPECFYYYRQERDGQDIAVRDERLFVHFPIFDWLNDKVGVWADARIERQLLRCKINTHLWALSRIERKLFGRYFAAAVRDIFKHGEHFKVTGVAWFVKGFIAASLRSIIHPIAGKGALG